MFCSNFFAKFKRNLSLRNNFESLGAPTSINVSEAYSEYFETSKMKRFVKALND